MLRFLLLSDLHHLLCFATDSPGPFGPRDTDFCGLIEDLDKNRDGDEQIDYSDKNLPNLNYFMHDSVIYLYKVDAFASQSITVMNK